MQPLRGSDVRQLNERVVLNLFYDYERVSQSDIVTLTGLKPSTVLRIFSNLEKDGEILMIDPEEEQAKRATVGRHPVYYRINPDAHYAIGLTFAKDNIELSILDFALNVVHTARAPFSFPHELDQLAEEIAAFIKKAVEDARIDPSLILGVGIACPGNVDPERGLLLSLAANTSIKSYPLQEKLESLLDTRVFLQGANLLAAQYYNRYGNMEARDRILYISIGSTVTASFYSRTPEGMLGGMPSLPVGWMLLQRPDSIVNMSQVPTLDDICSEASILNAVKTANIATMQELDEALREPNPTLETLAQHMSDGLSYCISNLSMLFQPQTVIIASRSGNFSRLLARLSADILNVRYFWPFEQEPYVLGKAHNFRKISRSAVDLVFDNEFNANLGWKKPKLFSQPQHDEE